MSCTSLELSTELPDGRLQDRSFGKLWIWKPWSAILNNFFGISGMSRLGGTEWFLIFSRKLRHRKEIVNRDLWRRSEARSIKDYVFESRVRCRFFQYFRHFQVWGLWWRRKTFWFILNSVLRVYEPSHGFLPRTWWKMSGHEFSRKKSLKIVIYQKSYQFWSFGTTKTLTHWWRSVILLLNCLVEV